MDGNALRELTDFDHQKLLHLNNRSGMLDGRSLVGWISDRSWIKKKYSRLPGEALANSKTEKYSIFQPPRGGHCSVITEVSPIFWTVK